MFTRYKGIDIPQNYSGNRFKSEIEPPITETKTHKPTSFMPTKTSISPAFESALKITQNAYQEENSFDTVSDFEANSYETDIENGTGLEQEFSAYEADVVDTFDNENQSQSNDYFEENERASTRQEKTLLDEFKPLIGKIIGNVNSEDLLLISLVILLMGESNESSNDLIIPLLFLLLYH